MIGVSKLQTATTLLALACISGVVPLAATAAPRLLAGRDSLDGFKARLAGKSRPLLPALARRRPMRQYGNAAGNPSREPANGVTSFAYQFGGCIRRAVALSSYP
jgi:hypothetical protein